VKTALARIIALVLLALGLPAITGCGPTPPTIVERGALKGHAREIVSIAVAPDGKTLASRGSDGIKIWDLSGGVEARSLPTDGSDFGSVTFAPDGKTIAFDRFGIGAVAWDVASGRERAGYVFRPGKPSPLNGSINAGWGLAYSPDGKTLAGGGSHGGEDGFLTLWETSGGEATELTTLRRPITAVSYSPDGKTVASGGMDGKIVLWDPAARCERLQIDANRSYLAPVVFSPDGRFVASANEARWVKLWEVSTGREAGVMKGHIKAVLSLAFSPDGKALVSGDSSGTLFVWDVVNARMLTLVESDQGKIWGLAFSPDGKSLISGGEDRLIHIWDVSWPDSAAR
jgi:WD40 repeat protein